MDTSPKFLVVQTLRLVRIIARAPVTAARNFMIFTLIPLVAPDLLSGRFQMGMTFSIIIIIALFAFRREK